MKNIFAILLMSAVGAFAQPYPVSVRTTNGTAFGLVQINPAAYTNNVKISSTNFVGNGGGLTNLQSTNIVGAINRASLGTTRTNIPVWTETFSGTLGNWENQGLGGTNALWQIVNGKLHASSSGSLTGMFLNYTNYVTCFENFTLQFEVTPLITNSTSWGIGVGIRSALISSDRNAWFRLWFNVANAGQLLFFTGTSNAPVSFAGLYTNDLFTVVVSNRYVCEIVRRGHIWSCQVSNTANGAVKRLTQGTTLGNTVLSGYDPQAGYVSLWSAGGSNEIDNISFTLNPVVDSQGRVPYLLVGDSITDGFSATNYALTFGGLLRTALGSGLQKCAAPGGGLTSVGLCTNEINSLRPANTIFMIGGNNTAAEWPLYTTFVNSLTNGVEYHCYPTPRDAQELSGLVKFISTNYPVAFQIDTFNPLREVNATNSGLRGEVDSGDGVHPNAHGHSIIYPLIMNGIGQ